MYDHRGKKLGLVISMLGLAGMLAERYLKLIFLKKLNPEQHYYLFTWIMLFGLILIAYSREKVDDERATAIRLKSTQIALMIMFAITCSIGLLQELHRADGFTIRGADLLLIASISILIYLGTFYVGLYRDSVWEFENKGLVYNLKHIPRNIWGILVYLAIAVLVILLTSQLSWA